MYIVMMGKLFTVSVLVHYID